MFFCACFPLLVSSLICFCQQAVRSLLGRNNGAGQAVNMKWACQCVKVCQSNGQRCAGVSTGLVIRCCCADRPAIETFFHFKAPRGFSGHRLNGSRGRGVWGEQVQSMGGAIPAAICFPFRGLGPCAPSDTTHGDTLPKPCPVAMAPRFGLTSAHVPSQPKGPPPLLASVDGEKEKEEEEDGWMDGKERLHR